MTLQWNNLGGTELERDKQLQSDWDRLNATRGNLPFMSAGAIALALRVFKARQQATLARAMRELKTAVEGEPRR